jgi:hypothetical protein
MSHVARLALAYSSRQVNILAAVRVREKLKVIIRVILYNYLYHLHGIKIRVI